MTFETAARIVLAAGAVLALPLPFLMFAVWYQFGAAVGRRNRRRP